jgi:hypothetical protein
MESDESIYRGWQVLRSGHGRYLVSSIIHCYDYDGDIHIDIPDYRYCGGKERVRIDDHDVKKRISAPNTHIPNHSEILEESSGGGSGLHKCR